MTELVAVRADDYEPLARFHAGFPGDTRGPELWKRRFRYWWDDNPSFDEGCVRGWMIREDDGNVAGFLGSVPSRFQLGMREERVFGATSWRVLPAYRSSSIQLYLAMLEAQGSSLLFNTSANATVERVLEYLKFRSLPSYASGRSFLVALDTGAAVRAYLQERFAWLPDAVAGVPLALAQAPLRAVLRASRGDVRHLERAGASFDDLWTRTRGRFGSTSVRSAAQVQWMCFASDDYRKTLLGCYDEGVLRGYAIFTGAMWRGVRVMELVDLWTAEPRSEILRALVAGALEHADSQGYGVVVLHDYGQEDALLFRRMGVFFTTADAPKHYYRLAGSDVMTVLGREGLSGLEGDRFV